MLHPVSTVKANLSTAGGLIQALQEAWAVEHDIFLFAVLHTYTHAHNYTARNMREHVQTDRQTGEESD